MAEAPNLTTSKVRLWDRLLSDYNVDSGDGLVLHPETELAAIVMATDDYIVSSGNSLTLNADSVWSGNISARVAAEYCPLVKVISGSTQYADMYVNNGTATVTEISTSTGYGTLLHALSTITSVRAVSGANSATNDYIPTERAVALALSGKQQLLSGGVCIKLTPGLNYTDVSVNVQSNTPLPSLASATQSRIPTEYVVRHAIDAGVAAGSNYASGLVNNLSTTIDNAGYATSNWVNSNFVHSGEQVSVGFATSDSAGIVYVPDGSGLSVGTSGKLSLNTAGSNTLGGVAIPAAGGLVLNGSAVSLGAAGYTTSRNSATSSGVAVPLGGVRVFSGGGLMFGSSSILAVSSAPVFPTIASAYTQMALGHVGGVVVMSAIESAVTERHKSEAIVPTVQAVWDHVSAHGYTALTSDTGITITGAASTGYTIGLAAATTQAIGGIQLVSSMTDTTTTNELPTQNAIADYIASRYVSKTDTATYNSSGIVQVNISGGLSITDGNLNLRGAGYVDYESSVSSGDAYVPIGGVRINKGGGLAIDDTSVLGLTPAKTVVWSDYTSEPLGGVRVFNWRESGGIELTSGNIYLRDAAVGSIGGIKLKSSFNSNSPATDNTLPTESAIYTFVADYVATHGGSGGGGGSYTTISPSSGILISGTAVAGYTIGLTNATATSLGGVTLADSITATVTSNAVPTQKAVADWVAAHGGAYTGPFKATQQTASTTVAAGIVKTLDGDIPISQLSSTGTLAAGSSLYLYGSSGVANSAGGYEQHQTTSWSLKTALPAKIYAGEMYTRLAYNSGGTMIQAQYGDIQHETWGADYRDEFAISRIPLVSSAANFLPYRFSIMNAGTLYGNLPLSAMSSAWGGLTSGGASINMTASTLTLAASAFKYPIPTNAGGTYSGTPTGANLSGLVVYSATGTNNGGLPVWLNIWSGAWQSTWGGHGADITLSKWRFVVDSVCREGYAPGIYSVRLGTITETGAPVQFQSGSIAVRGVWA